MILGWNRHGFKKKVRRRYEMIARYFRCLRLTKTKCIGVRSNANTHLSKYSGGETGKGRNKRLTCRQRGWKRPERETGWEKEYMCLCLVINVPKCTNKFDITKITKHTVSFADLNRKRCEPENVLFYQALFEVGRIYSLKSFFTNGFRPPTAPRNRRKPHTTTCFDHRSTS